MTRQCLPKKRNAVAIRVSATVKQMQAQFENLLHRIVKQPDSRLSELQSPSREEKQQEERRKVERDEANLRNLRSARRTGYKVPKLPTPPPDVVPN